MINYQQPSLFVSHGTLYETFKSEQLKADFQKIRELHVKNLPSAIVVFSGHWQADIIAVTTGLTMNQMEEGFPPEFQAGFITNGNPELAERIIDTLQQSGIEAKAEPNRALDHGALIPLLLLFPTDKIPVVQISQHYLLDPVLHQQVAEALKPFRKENILFIGSGGLVHNRNEIQKFGGHSIAPADWAQEFDDFITHKLADTIDTNYPAKLI